MNNQRLTSLIDRPVVQRLKQLNLKKLGLSLVAISVVVLSPSTAWAANLALGERGVIGLFRGAGGLLGSLFNNSGPSGIDTLASRITTAFPSYNLTVQVFDSYQGSIFLFQEVGSTQGTTFLDQFDDIGAIGLIGYSGGGLSAIRTANNQPPQSVDLLVQIDSYEPLTGNSREDEVLPDTVQTGINYYQRRNRYNFFQPGWDLTDLGGARSVSGSQNINVEELFNDRSITHSTIDDDVRLHNRILQDIATHVLPNLEVAPTPAIAQRSTVSQATQISAQSVPEPSLLWAIGAIGGGLYLAKKHPTS